MMAMLQVERISRDIPPLPYRVILPKTLDDLIMLTVDLMFVLAWCFVLWGDVERFFETVHRITEVKTFVTGFWEVYEKQEYCLGPIQNPCPQYIENDEIYIIVEEDVAILNHSLWPTLQSGVIEVEASLYDYSIIREAPAPPKFAGQLHWTEVTRVHRVIYVLQYFTRALSLFIVRGAVRALPYPLQKTRILSSAYEVYPAPTQDQLREATLANQFTADKYKPLRDDLIRGHEALEAARRAGFRY